MILYSIAIIWLDIQFYVYLRHVELYRIILSLIIFMFLFNLVIVSIDTFCTQ